LPILGSNFVAPVGLDDLEAQVFHAGRLGWWRIGCRDLSRVFAGGVLAASVSGTGTLDGWTVIDEDGERFDVADQGGGAGFTIFLATIHR
jgi:hypothetical protein